MECQFGHFPKVLKQNQLDFENLSEDPKGKVFHPFFAMRRLYGINLTRKF